MRLFLRSRDGNSHARVNAAKAVQEKFASQPDLVPKEGQVKSLFSRLHSLWTKGQLVEAPVSAPVLNHSCFPDA